MMGRIFLTGLLAIVLASAPRLSRADDAGDFFTLFERTCAKSLTDPVRFVEDAKAAGAKFKFAVSGQPEAQAILSNGTTYWVTDDRVHGLTVTMTAIGSAADRQLSCIVYAPPHTGITLDDAIARVRAAMGIGAPTRTQNNVSAGEIGASWFIGTDPVEQRIGVDIAAPNSDAPTSIAVITRGH